MNDRLTLLLDVTEKVLSYIVSAIIAVMTIVTFYQVVLRYVFESATIWAEEVVRYSFVWLVLLTSAIAVRRNRHIRIDFFVNKLSPGPRFLLEMVSSLMILVFLIFLLREGLTIVASTGHQSSQALKIPMSYPYLAIPLGTILMIVFMLELMVKQYRHYRESRNRRAALDSGTPPTETR